MPERIQFLMVGKRKDLKKYDDCMHKQGFFSWRYNDLKLKCRHCKLEIHCTMPRELDAARKHRAAIKHKQTKLPEPQKVEVPTS